MASPVPPPAEQPLADDSPLEKFLEKAAPILAVERGINARSRVRLLAVARDVGLPDGEFDQAVRLLQRAPAKTESAEDKQTEPFRRYLHAKLESSTVKTFTPALEGRVVAIAIEKFELTDAQARTVIGQVAAERGVKQFSQQDCEDYVADLVAERIGDDEWLDDESVNRLRAAGAQWGLSIAEVDALIVAKATANRDGRGKAESSTKLVMTIAVVAGVGVFLVLAVLFVWGRLGDSNTAANGGPEEPPEITPGEEPRLARPPKWWNADLTISQTKTRSAIPEYRPVYDLLCAADVAERGKGYEQLVALVKGGDDATESRKLLAQVVAGSHALDPDEEAAEKLRAALLASAVPESKKLPAGPDAYDRAIWAVETALEAVYHEDASDEQAEAMVAALGEALGISLDREKPRPSVEKRCLAALAAALYRQLAAGAGEAPGLARKLHLKLANWAQNYLELAEFEQLDINVLTAVLAASPNSWRDYESLLAASAGSKDPLVVLRVLEIFERSSDPALQSFLGELLLLRVPVRAKSSAPADVAAAVREGLGVVLPTAPVTAKDRWETLRTQAKEPLTRRAPLVTEPAKMLEESLLFAHLGTLGCAVAQQEPGFALFDQLVKDGPPSLASKKKDDEPTEPAETPRPRGTAPVSATDQKDLAKYLDGLAKYKETSPQLRQSYVRGLAILVDRLSELEPDQGAVVARFLLAEKPDDEQRRITEPMETICRWKSVRLALADLLADPATNVKIPVPLAGQLFSKALRREVALSSADWPESIREELLRSVLADLASVTTTSSSEAAGGFDKAADALLGLYITRAKLLGLGPAQYRAAATPALALETLASHQAVQLGGSAGRPVDAEYLARLPHEMAVVEYLGNNDVRRTVLAQRVWLRLLAMALARKRPEQASQAKALVDELAARDLKATHLLLQLRDGEAVTLSMWLLHAPRE